MGEIRAAAGPRRQAHEQPVERTSAIRRVTGENVVAGFICQRFSKKRMWSACLIHRIDGPGYPSWFTKYVAAVLYYCKPNATHLRDTLLKSDRWPNTTRHLHNTATAVDEKLVRGQPCTNPNAPHDCQQNSFRSLLYGTAIFQRLAGSALPLHLPLL